MKLCYFNDYKLGVVKGDAVVDVSAVVQDIPHTGPGDLMNGLIERFDAYRPKLEAAAASGSGERMGVSFAPDRSQPARRAPTRSAPSAQSLARTSSAIAVVDSSPPRSRVRQPSAIAR